MLRAYNWIHRLYHEKHYIKRSADKAIHKIVALKHDQAQLKGTSSVEELKMKLEVAVGTAVEAEELRKKVVDSEGEVAQLKAEGTDKDARISMAKEKLVEMDRLKDKMTKIYEEAKDIGFERCRDCVKRARLEFDDQTNWEVNEHLLIEYVDYFHKLDEI